MRPGIGGVRVAQARKPVRRNLDLIGDAHGGDASENFLGRLQDEPETLCFYFHVASPFLLVN